ncbi:UDP-N-acetylmuramoyl-L-alanyl-D-glutamate--2,6-diaminopimelate ligase [Sneathia sanguinegens]|uniref:UDP-N-acetylmuramoyl-L-alanyl-D-glutamate--2, 6-diaminopimelate ligase n=1 Tax=Sneathia sanguinegens TaxID=40543 RepID=UPI002805E34F|nr:UDP-N-acetylmuramoyl-L-alanyl-D-glutamate--2,6-diaminopimelate ligase [Sneathia sanguinegens]MDU7496375.1 UDP-N-acetylmuramoyl-L-alanyl-D-glutamate--2,6-diaminopimelate ligase [Sneathia sanguinegens]
MFENVEYEILQKGKDFVFNSIEYDSRKIQKGDIFVAMKGFSTDGNNYIDKAIKNGAVCILTDEKEHNFSAYKDISFYYIKDLRKHLGVICANLYGHPEKKLKIIGVTGTNGKTTSTYILENILENSSRVGTTNYRVKDKFYEAHNTTPESMDIIKLMSESVEKGVEYFIMEVSSHALALGRVDMLEFDGAIFTNLTQDHLDYHKTFEAYFKAKCHLMDLLKKDAKISLNVDDKYIKTIHSKKAVSFGIKNGEIRGEVLEYTNKGMNILIKVKDEIKKFHTSLIGEYNLYNILGVVSVLINLGIDFNEIVDKISKMKPVVGRFELIENNLNARIVVDYAHTPDGLENVLNTLKNITKGKVYCVFGAGGDRDKTKRPIMGKIATKYCDYLILTSDNPRTEDPLAILSDIEEGIKEQNYTKYIKIEKREEAIKYAISLLKENDGLMIAGKGHETYQIIGTKTRYFSDQEEVKKCLQNF